MTIRPGRGERGMTIQQAWFKLTLEEDVVLRADNATVGPGRGLTFIRGGALLGAVAGRLYAQLAKEDLGAAFTVFHSGKVRFGNGLPIAETADAQMCAAYPMPLALHERKDQPAFEADGVNRQRDLLFNYLRDEERKREPDHPKRQLRGGYLTSDWRRITPCTSIHMKTRIDSQTGRALDGALYGFNALRRGQRFLATLEADNDVEKTLFQRVVEELAQMGSLRLGESRLTEFGRVRCEQVQASGIGSIHDPGRQGPNEEPAGRQGLAEEPAGQQGLAEKPAGKQGLPREPDGADLPKKNELTLWLLSDLVALDPYGSPTLAPKPEWLGLPNGRLISEKTFVRSNVFAPYNSHRRHADLERASLLPGGVLTFELDSPLEDGHLARIKSGLGLYRETGLGRVWANPPLLVGDRPAIASDQATESITQAPLAQEFSPRVSGSSTRSDLPQKTAGDSKPGETDLVKWLKRRHEGGSLRSRAAHKAEQLVAELKNLYISARNTAGAWDGEFVGPKPSQWGRVMEAARNRSESRDEAGQGNHQEKTDALLMALFRAPNWTQSMPSRPEGICADKAGGQGWTTTGFAKNKPISFREWFWEICRLDGHGGSTPPASDHESLDRDFHGKDEKATEINPPGKKLSPIFVEEFARRAMNVAREVNRS